MSKTILCDFDGTIVEHKYPLIGKPMPGAIETLRDLQAAGFKLILWTCREDHGHNINKQYLRAAVEAMREHGIEFDAVNEALEDDFRPEGVLRRKPHAQVHIDDHNLGGFPGWAAVRRELLGDYDGTEA